MTLKVQRHEPRPGAPEWAVTFADLMCLLMTFFVLLLSFSSLEVRKFESAAESMRNAFAPRLDILGLSEASPVGAKPIPMPGQAEVWNRLDQNIVVALRQAIEKSGMTGGANVEVTQRGVALRVHGDALFESGSTGLSEDSLGLLAELARLAPNAPGEIEVEGHTDDVPIASVRFLSNWELSAARAGSAVRYLTTHGLPAARLKAIGYADTRPLVPNTSAANRAMNRRVEFVFVRQRHSAAAGGSQP